MNPLHLTARNYRSFESLDVDLPDGCVAVLGENGAGKSSIVNAVDLAIFGPESRSLADAITEGVADEELLLELEFEHAGGHYRVRRTYSPRGRGKTTLDFEQLYDARMAVSGEPRGQHWHPLTSESVKETQERICQCIGLTRETFRASAFLAQGDGAAFTEAQPRDRKRILAEVLGLEAWTVLAECARVDRRLLETRAAALAGKTAQAEEQAALLPELERDYADTLEAETVAADNVADLERSHQQLAVEYQQAREHAAGRAAAEAELKTAREALEQLQRLDVAATEAVLAIGVARDELEQLPTQLGTEAFETREAELAALVTMYDGLVRDRKLAVQAAADAVARRSDVAAKAQQAQLRADQLRAQIGHLEEGSLKSCPTCKQALGAEARHATIESLTAQALAAIDETNTLLRERDSIAVVAVPAEPTPPPRTELETVRGQLASARAAQAERARLEERITGLQQTVDARPSPDALVTATSLALEKRDAVTAAGAPPDIAAITAQGNLVAEQLKTARRSLEQHKTQRARLEERILVAKAAATKLAEHADERKQLDESLVVTVALERAFSPDGVPALIVENSAIPYLETEANRILVELGTSFRVELRTQAALKSGDGLRDTLDVIVCSEKGERPYETFSGGERTRINLALRIALARLLAHRRGAESRLLVVDEPDGLDDAGMAALVGVLRSLEGDFDKLYIVSHVPGLRDSFDTTLSVLHEEHGSRVVEAGVFEAVAA